MKMPGKIYAEDTLHSGPLWSEYQYGSDDPATQYTRSDMIPRWLCVNEYPPPKDGTFFDVFCGHRICDVVWFGGNKKRNIKGGFHYIYDTPGYGEEPVLIRNFTHWMPLLPPPEKGNE